MIELKLLSYAMKFFYLIFLLPLYARSFAQIDPSLTETGTASYYAKKFEGRRCSSGDIFRNDSLTAAHKTLKFGTMLKVTNLKNDSVVIVRVNDRLPKKSKRKIDLTRQAAKQLNFIERGLTKVRIEILEYP